MKRRGRSVSKGTVVSWLNELRQGRIPQLADIRGEVDALREVAVDMRKHRLTPTEAAAGLILWIRLREIGVEPRAIEAYVEMCRRISPKDFPVDKFVDSCIRLHSLEVKLERPYDEAVDELGKAIEGAHRELGDLNSQLEASKARKTSLGNELEALEGRRISAKARLEAEVREAEERLSLARRALEDTVSKQERLKRLDPEKLNQLAEFVENYNKLGFSAEEVQRLSGWEVSLALMGIKSKELGRFIEEKGPLEAQISRTRREAKEEERKLDFMRAESKKIAKEMYSLQSTVSKLSRLGTVLKRRKALIPCKICGGEGVLIDVPSRPVAANAVSAGLVWNAPCARCGRWAQYSAWDIFAGVGLLALPES
jgi:hypothetical protein